MIIAENCQSGNNFDDSEPPDFRAGTGRDKPMSLSFSLLDAYLADILNLPATKSLKGLQALEAIILDAVLEAAGTGRWISYSRRASHYSNRYGPYGYRIIVSTIDNLVADGMLLHEKAPAGRDVGWQSRFRASPELIAMCRPVPLVTVNPGELVRLRDSGKMPMDYRDTANTIVMRRNMQMINEAVASIDIGLDIPGARRMGNVAPNVLHLGDYAVNTAHNSLYRVFNGDFNHGGRFYGLWVQGLKIKEQEHRQMITINGSPTVEEDHSQIHPRMVYGLAEKSKDGDAYDISGWDRDLCKRAFNILLNAGNYLKALGAVANEIGLAIGMGADKGCYNGDCRNRAAVLIEAIKARHQPIAGYFHSGIGVVLQNRDARMAEYTMMELLDRGIPSLPIHDSFIVEDRHQDDLLEVMDAAWSVA
jgi:hypothetical protein